MGSIGIVRVHARLSDSTNIVCTDVAVVAVGAGGANEAAGDGCTFARANRAGVILSAVVAVVA